MKAKTQYLTTVYTTQHGVILFPCNTGIVETFCQAYWSHDKRKRATAFDGFYFNAELTLVK